MPTNRDDKRGGDTKLEEPSGHDAERLKAGLGVARKKRELPRARMMKAVVQRETVQYRHAG